MNYKKQNSDLKMTIIKKMMDDKNRMCEAIRKGEDVAEVAKERDIKIVKPL